MRELDYLKLLSTQYPNVATVTSEIINLKAILNLPKGTEHFLTDLHGEYEAFDHMIRTASGVLKIKIDDIFSSEILEDEKKELAGLIFYPEEKLKILAQEEKLSNDWYRVTLYRIIRICKIVSSKYSRSKVRKSLPKNFEYIIEELLHLRDEDLNKKGYYSQILETIIETGQAEEFITSISYLIQALAVDKLHIIGDIYDRGPEAHKIMDALRKHHNCDIQWGNHDILWMGAGLGQKSLVATSIRVSLRYGLLKMLEEGYGINMLPLARFAMKTYENVDCSLFTPIKSKNIDFDEKDNLLIAQMHKAIAIIQFKLEANLMKKRTEFNMENQTYLDCLDLEKGVINYEGKEYKLKDTDFPTLKGDNYAKLTPDEKELIEQLSTAFKTNEKLQKHIRFLFNQGSVYLKYNGNLLFHGCVPMTPEGELKEKTIYGKSYKGKELMDFFDNIVKKSYSYQYEEEDYRDWLWYLWRGKNSPLFGKHRMSTFFSYFTSEKSLKKENKDPYYSLRENEDTCIKILNEFGLDSNNGHIINGHTPVLQKAGESPIKGNGKLLVIDGGFSAAYQPKTGIAGYTLIYNSYGLIIASHKPFESTEKAISEGYDIVASASVVERKERQKVGDTDTGAKLKKKINDLFELLSAYNKGVLKEKLK